MAWPIVAFLLPLSALAPGLGRAAEARFRELVNQLPRAANAVLILNMEKAKSSPMGQREGWQANIEKAFEAGLVRVPPQASRFVLAAHIDFEYMATQWEAMVLDLGAMLPLERLAKTRGGTMDTIEGLPAVILPSDACIMQFGPKTLAAMGPANRQMVTRWVLETRRPDPPPLSPYLHQAATYSDKAGSDIILAIDLEGAISPEAVRKYLKKKEDAVKEWKTDSSTVGKLLSEVRGIRVGVRIDEQPTARIALDFASGTSAAAPFAKALLVELLEDVGASVQELQSWTAQAEKCEIWLGGTMTRSGLRRLMSLVDSAAAQEAAITGGPSPGDPASLVVKVSKDHFHAVTQMFNDLKQDMRSSKNLASTQLWFDKYAKRIERLPILNVDEDLLQYSAFVATCLRKAGSMVRTMGIQSGVRQAQIVSSGSSYGYDNYAYGRFGFGPRAGYGGHGPGGQYAAASAEAKAVESQRRVVRAEEQAKAFTDIYQVRDAVVAATSAIRRQMTQKYQVEF
jgi:hypothetical protein